MLGVVLALVGVQRGFASEETDQLLRAANNSVAAASSAVQEARFAIEKGKKLVLQVPADSDLGKEIEQVLTQASQSWDAALLALSDAKKSAAKVGSAKNEAIAKDYKLLATSTSSLALSGAKSVQASIFFIESVAGNTDSIGVARVAVQDALVGAEKVEKRCNQVKVLIAKKYSK
jgi:hypothetical protein